MMRFNNDYNHSAHECVLKLLEKTAGEGYGGYGEDIWCDEAKELIKKEIDRQDADVFFFAGATLANFVVTAAALRPIESVICAQTGHINCHEAASIENTGHKILELSGVDGKLSAQQIEACASEYFSDGEPEHLTVPKMVYISFPTELGTLYSLEELKEIRRVCDKYGMYLFVDGARMGYGLGSEANDVSLRDFGQLADVFYLGGTKCGALFGEAVVLLADSLKHRFKTYMKQNGAVLAKGWLLGLQFYALLENGEYFKITARADKLAMRLKVAFAEKGIPSAVDSPTNQQFVILTPLQEEKLAEKYIFEGMGTLEDGRKKVRFCTSWSTTEDEIDALIADIQVL